MAKRRMGIMAFLFCLCLCLWPCRAQAASAVAADLSISPYYGGSLTVIYRWEGTPLEQVPVRLYKIAEASETYEYTLTPAFAVSGLELNGVQTVGEWDVIRSTLEAYVVTGEIEADQWDVTDSMGWVFFEPVTPGLYLVMADPVALEDGNCVFQSALVSLPGWNMDNRWEYDVRVSAKSELLPPTDPDEEITWKVVKLWKGDEGKAHRPDKVLVELYKNGIHHETVTLSEENHWSYSWTVKDDGADWTVMEREVLPQYTMTLEERGNTFVLTNCLVTEEPERPPVEPPKTGDTSHLVLYMVLMYVSGTMVILLGMLRKRQRYEETS